MTYLVCGLITCRANEMCRACYDLASISGLGITCYGKASMLTLAHNLEQLFRGGAGGGGGSG